jgi:ribonuclease BN (tRNA processing enzyme)
MKTLKVKILGSGGAFDGEKLNSCFLITDGKQNTLIDCGYNVFSYIQKNNIEVDEVIVTHTHFDHIGSLESLVYYNYFVKGITTRIYSGPKVIERLKYILDVNKIYENGQVLQAPICEFMNINELFNNHKYNKFFAIEVNHIVTPCYGIAIIGKNKDIIISGDTKASKNLVDFIEREFEESPDKEIVVFHDYSEWDDPLRNIHCCKTDFEKYYGPLLNKYNNLKFIFYHNGENVGVEETIEF